MEVAGEAPTKTTERYVFPFEKLEVWQEAIALAGFILELLEQIPQNKHLRLVSQMAGAATSVAQNIAEEKGGSTGRNSCNI